MDHVPFILHEAEPLFPETEETGPGISHTQTFLWLAIGNSTFQDLFIHTVNLQELLWLDCTYFRSISYNYCGSNSNNRATINIVHVVQGIQISILHKFDAI